MKPFVRKKSFEPEEYDVHNPYIYTEYIEAIYIATFILFINPECFRFLNKHIQRINSLRHNREYIHIKVCLCLLWSFDKFFNEKLHQTKAFYTNNLIGKLLLVISWISMRMLVINIRKTLLICLHKVRRKFCSRWMFSGRPMLSKNC